MKKERKFTLKTTEGSLRLLALFLCLIFACSLAARLVETDFGKVKVERLTIDTRGATQLAEIYYPSGTNDKDTLPALVVTHGGGIEMGSYKQFAQEFARRGFAVLLVDSYGNGYSEEPAYEETGQGEGGYNDMLGIRGIYDAVNYLRTLKFIDHNNIGVVGHSSGACWAYNAAGLDCFYFNYNDLLINILYNDFGLTFTAEEITKDAAVLAKERLSADQFKHFEYLAADAKELYDTRIKTLCLLGVGGCDRLPEMVLEVGGHEVTRTCKVNIIFVCGEFESQTLSFASNADFKAAFMTDDDIKYDTWYSVDDVNDTYRILGSFKATTADEEAAIHEASEARALRMYTVSGGDSHSQLYFSINAVANSLEAVQVAHGIESDLGINNQSWYIRAIFNCIAMLAMLALAFPLVSLLLKTKFFAPALGKAYAAEEYPKVRKEIKWVIYLITVALAFWTLCHYTQYGNYIKFLGIKFLADTSIFQLQVTTFPGRIWLFVMAIASVVFMLIYVVASRKTKGEGLAVLNLRMKISAVLKAVLIAVICIAAQYTTLLIIRYLFGQDYRFFQTVFSEIRPERWLIIFPYILLLFPSFLAIGAANNYVANRELPEWKDTLIVILVNSVGVWLVFAVVLFQYHVGGAWDGKQLISPNCVWGLNLLIPVTVYISRKMYNVTKQLWTGALLNTILVFWIWCSSNSLFYYTAQNWLGNVLGS